MNPKPPPTHPATRLYLATPVLGDPGDFVRQLRDLLDAADIAAVLLRLAPADERTLINRIKAMAPAIQAHDIAVLLDGHVDLVARSGADGAHVSGTDAMQEALSALKPDRMVGTGGLHSRHDAMTAGEAGADYLLFGEPDEHGERPTIEDLVERLSWWAEVFEPPCVGYAHALTEVDALVATGADFILLGAAIWDDPRGARAALQDAMTVIASRSIVSADGGA